MDVNPGALLLIVCGIVAVIVGVRGTQSGAGSLLTGRTSQGAALPAPASSSTSPAAGSSPTGSTGGAQNYQPGSSVGYGGAGRLS